MYNTLFAKWDWGGCLLHVIFSFWVSRQAFKQAAKAKVSFPKFIMVYSICPTWWSNIFMLAEQILWSLLRVFSLISVVIWFSHFYLLCFKRRRDMISTVKNLVQYSGRASENHMLLNVELQTGHHKPKSSVLIWSREEWRFSYLNLGNEACHLNTRSGSNNLGNQWESLTLTMRVTDVKFLREGCH